MHRGTTNRRPADGRRRWLGAWLAAVGGLALLAATPAGAASPVINRIVARGELRVGITGAQPPLNATDGEGKLFGLEVDLATMLARAIGVEVEFVRMPFGQLLSALEREKVDVVISGVTITPARNARVAFVGPYFVSGKAFLARKETLPLLDDPSRPDGEPWRLAALEGSTSEQIIQRLLPIQKLVSVSDYDAAVALLLDGKIDALVADYPALVLAAYRYRDRGLATLSEPLNVEPIGIALPANDPLFVNLVDNYLEALEGTGLFEELREKWFEHGPWLDLFR